MAVPTAVLIARGIKALRELYKAHNEKVGAQARYSGKKGIDNKIDQMQKHADNLRREAYDYRQRTGASAGRSKESREKYKKGNWNSYLDNLDNEIEKVESELRKVKKIRSDYQAIQKYLGDIRLANKDPQFKTQTNLKDIEGLVRPYINAKNAENLHLWQFARKTAKLHIRAGQQFKKDTRSGQIRRDHEAGFARDYKKMGEKANKRLDGKAREMQNDRRNKFIGNLSLFD